MKAYLINLVVFSMLVMFAMANEDTEENSWLWTAGKLVGGAALGFVAAPAALGAIGFTYENYYGVNSGKSL